MSLQAPVRRGSPATARASDPAREGGGCNTIKMSWDTLRARHTTRGRKREKRRH
jgi:hypothetical protein